MAMSASPSVDDHHLKRLLEMRAARGTADMNHHRRFPSGSLSEMSDSPSVYSHAQFSPQPIDRAELQANTDAFNFAIPSQYQHRAHSRDPEPRTPRFDRERLNDPSASTLILDDASISSRADSERYYDSDHEAELDGGNEDEEGVPRMSYLGPKMRFHSPAPWEMAEEPVMEQDEPDDDTRSFVSRRGRNWTKGFGLGTSKLGGASRPSGESTRSSGKKSSDTSSSSQVSAFGALQALAQTSSSSIGLVSSSSTQSSSQAPLPSHMRARTISNANASHIPQPRQPTSRSNTYDVPSAVTMPRSRSPASFIPRPDTADSYRAESPDSHYRQSNYSSTYSHPYANPDLSSNYPQREPMPVRVDPYRSGDGRAMKPAESGMTLHDTVSTPSSRRGSVATVSITPDTSPGSAGDSSGDIASLKRPVGNLHGKTISGPISVEGHTLRSAASISSIASRARGDQTFQPPNGLARWNDLPASPTFTLISLEQAQAQAKARSATATGAPSANAFLDSEPPVRSKSGSSHRTRARSSSTGAKGRNALQAPQSAENDASQDQTNSGASPRPPLKHKRSGFMRLFNGKEKDRSAVPPSPPPPVPTLPESSPAASLSSRPSKPSIARVPVPVITPPAPYLSDGYFPSSEDVGDAPPTAKAQDGTSPLARGRRQFPPLTIVPPSEKPGGRVPSQSPNSADPSKPDNRSRTTLRPEPSQTRGGLAPLSAPPGTTEFPSLSLRPVSTVFSAHFADHLLGGDTPNDSEPDSSIATAFSPLSLSPGFSLRSATDKGGHEPIIASDDAASIIQALREQMASSRKAYQAQIWELEGQIRDLRAEVDELRAHEGSGSGEYCSACGRGGLITGHSPVDGNDSSDSGDKRSVVNRPRARTGVGGTRFVSK